MKRLAAIVAAVLLAGCASTLPPCAPYKYRLALGDEGEVYVVIDEEGMEQLAGLVNGIAEGKCRLRKKGEV